MFFYVKCSSNRSLSDIQSIDIELSEASTYYRYAVLGFWPDYLDEPFPFRSAAVAFGAASGTYRISAENGFSYTSNRLALGALIPSPSSSCDCGHGNQVNVRITIALLGPRIKEVTDQFNGTSQITEQEMNTCSGCSQSGVASFQYNTRAEIDGLCDALAPECVRSDSVSLPVTDPVNMWMRWSAGNGCKLPMQIIYGSAPPPGSSTPFLTTNIDEHRAAGNSAPGIPNRPYVISTNSEGGLPFYGTYQPFEDPGDPPYKDTPYAKITLKSIVLNFSDGSVEAGQIAGNNSCCTGRCSQLADCNYWNGDLLDLSFSSCFGGGAVGSVIAPSGEPGTADGPISSVSLTNGGSGYAKLGRVAPTVTLANKGQQAATATVALSKLQDSCKVDYWAVSGLTVSDGGCGFVDGQPLTVSLATGDTQESAVSGAIVASRGMPTLSASASPGAGATFSVSLESNEDDPQTWRVSSVSVSGTTSGYTENSKLTFSGPCAVDQSGSTDARIRTGRLEPTLSVSVSSSGGSGAVLTPTVTSNGGTPETWGISSVAINSGGRGYSPWDSVNASGGISDGFFGDFYAVVDTVDEDGAITSVSVYSSGMYYASDGVIQSVEVNDGGQWYRDGVLSGVTVSSGGNYYREDAAASPYVASVFVKVSQQFPSSGSGAVITAKVDGDTSSAAFGKIESLALVSGGSGYLLRSCSNPLP